MTYAILAETTRVDRYNAMRQGLTEGGGSRDLAGVIIVVMVVLALVALAVLGRGIMRRHRSATNTPRSLFRAAMAHMKLSRDDAKFLTRLAATADMAHPAVMLLSPQLLAMAVGQAYAAQPISTQEQHRCEVICQQLFGQPLPNLPNGNPSG